MGQPSTYDADQIEVDPVAVAAPVSAPIPVAPVQAPVADAKQVIEAPAQSNEAGVSPV
jgi:hypothetical protein